jgi:hypothetical protein
MKITSKRIKELMLEELGPTLDEVMNEMGMGQEQPQEIELVNYHGQELPPPDMLGDPDYEGEMARLQLLKASRYACDLTDMLKDTDQLPAWIQSKITKASDYLSIVKHYLSDRIELAHRDAGHTGSAIEIELEEMLKHEDDEWNVYDSKGKKKLGSHPSKKKALAQIGAIEASKARRNEQIAPAAATAPSAPAAPAAKPANPISSKIGTQGTSASTLKKAQIVQAKGAGNTEFSPQERTIILDIKTKIEQLASMPDVDLVKIRPKLQQVLALLYKTFDKQVQASQTQISQQKP